MNANNANLPNEGFARLKDFVGKGKLIPISRSAWYLWVRSGKAPKPIQIGPRTSVYRVDEIREFLTAFANGGSKEGANNDI